MSTEFEVQRLVTCPVCCGKGQLSYQVRGGCQCCGGTGAITESRGEMLARIRADIAARLAQQPWKGQQR